MNRIEHTIFAILRSAFGIEKIATPVRLRPREWKKLFNLALKQHVSALVYDELKVVGNDMPEETRCQWRACYDFCVKRFDVQLITAIQLSEMLKTENIRMLLLKGAGIALTYPKPQLRECVDIDIYCFADCGRVNKFVVSSGIDKEAKENGTEEFCFKFNGIEVENHSKFTKESNAAQLLIGTLLMQMSEQNQLSQDKRLHGILLPSPQMGALLLIVHTLSHLAWSGITLRHLCDVTMYFRNHKEDIDLESLRRVMKDAGMERSAALSLNICNRLLGLDVDISGWVQCGKDEEAAVLHSIFHPFKGSSLTCNPIKKFHRKVVMYRFRSRLHQIVYGEKFPDGFLKSFAFLNRTRFFSVLLKRQTL